MEESGCPTYRLLQPELLTHEELVVVLRRYHLTSNVKSKKHEELVEIFNRVALPLPQRTYRMLTWRERLLAKKQNRRKISIGSREPQTSPRSSASIKANSAASTNSSHQIQTNPPRERLKPPPEPEAREKKIIKISSTSTNPRKRDSTESTSDSDKDKTDEPNKRKRIRIDFSDSSERSTPTPKVVRRSSSDKSPSQPVSKHRRIVI